MSLLREEADRFICENAVRVIDTWRPKFHLVGECGWINDPNGFIQYKGLYHQFYQHYPYSSEWGPMYWGHATSSNLVKWNYHPIALAPDMPYDREGCFSGSAIEVDGKLYLMYTGHVITMPENKAYTQTQCLAMSLDGYRFDKL